MIYVALKKLRSDKGGITQSELAGMLGCEQSYVSQVESGRRPLSDNMIEKLKTEFGDIGAYITEMPDKAIVQNNTAGDNIGGDKILYAHKAEDKNAEIVRLSAQLDAAKGEIEWLRSLVKELTLGKES